MGYFDIVKNGKKVGRGFAMTGENSHTMVTQSVVVVMDRADKVWVNVGSAMHSDNEKRIHFIGHAL